MKTEDIQNAQEKFKELILGEEPRIEAMKRSSKPTDFTALDKIVVGILPGDGVGPILMKQGIRVLKELVKDEIETGKIELREIEGLTIENRVAKLESLPEEVLEEVKKCNVLLKGPMTTPRAGDGLPNLVSVNSLLRRRLDLFAAVRPIRIPDKNIDWTFFRENIEGEYLWGNKGIQVDDDLAVDFKVQTMEGSERIARAAFEFARKNGKKNVTIVTKANMRSFRPSCWKMAAALRWGMIPPRPRPMSHGPAMTMTRASGSMSGDITVATAPLWNRTLRRGYRSTSAFTTSASGRPKLPAFTSITPPSALWTLGHFPSRPATPRMRSSTTISASRLKTDRFWRGGI